VRLVRVDSTNASEWLPQLQTFVANVDQAAFCGVVPVPKPERWDAWARLTGYELGLVEDGRIRGFIAAGGDRTRRGGGHVKFILTDPPDAAMYTMLGDFVCARWGWAWGRVTDDTIRNLMVTEMPEAEISDWDPAVVVYRRP
jgi:hypothetical protein